MKKYNTQKLQEKYEQWHELLEAQKRAQKQWLQAQALLDELQEYYFSKQWRSDYHSDIDLTYSGKVYSILSEDTIWNAITDRDEQARRWIRLGEAALARPDAQDADNKD